MSKIIQKTIPFSFYLFLLAALPFITITHARAQSFNDRQILLARQFAECSGAYYAASEVVTTLNGPTEKSTEFHEIGNGFLLAAAGTLAGTKQSEGFDNSYKRAEKRASTLKSSWLRRISNVGDMGVAEINHVTNSCTQNLSKQRDNILKYIHQYVKKTPTDAG